MKQVPLGSSGASVPAIAVGFMRLNDMAIQA